MIILRESTPVARKLHYCGVCDLPIPAGMRHYAQINTYDGVLTWRAHLGCNAVICTMGDSDSDGVMHLDGETTEAIREWCGPWITEMLTVSEGHRSRRRSVSGSPLSRHPGSS